MESLHSPQESSEQPIPSLTQLTRCLTKQFEVLERNNSTQSSSSTGVMEPQGQSLRTVHQDASSKKLFSGCDTAKSPLSQDVPIDSSLDGTKVDTRLSADRQHQSPSEQHTSRSCSPLSPKAITDVRCAKELIENLTAIFACTREVAKSDSSLSLPHTPSNVNQLELECSSLQDTNSEDLRSTNKPHTTEEVDLNTSKDVEECPQAITVQSNLHSPSSQSPVEQVSPKFRVSESDTLKDPTDEVQHTTNDLFPEITEEEDMHLMAVEVGSVSPRIQPGDAEHMYIYQSGVLSEGPVADINPIRNDPSEKQGEELWSFHQCSNAQQLRGNGDNIAEEPRSKSVPEETQESTKGARSGSNSSDIVGAERINHFTGFDETPSTSSVGSSPRDGGRVLRRSCHRRAKAIAQPNITKHLSYISSQTESDTERTLSACSESEDREVAAAPVRRRQRGKGVRGARSSSLAGAAASGRSTQARRLVVKSKVATLRKKQRQSVSGLLFKRGGVPRKGCVVSCESSESSDGNVRGCLGRKSRRRDTGCIESSDQDYNPSPSKKRRTATTTKVQSSLKQGTALADILTNVPEVDIKTTPTKSMNTDNTSKSSTVSETTPSEGKKHVRPDSLEVDGLPPNKISALSNSLEDDDVSPDTPSERIEESPREKESNVVPSVDPTKPHYLGKVNLRLTSCRRSRMHSSSESTPLSSPEFALQNKSLTKREKRTSRGLKTYHRKLRSHEATSDKLSNHYSVLMSWEKDYALGEYATNASILYAIEKMSDQLASKEGDWLEKAKLIWNQWRHKVSGKERFYYLERAKQNRKWLADTSHGHLSSTSPSKSKRRHSMKDRNFSSKTRRRSSAQSGKQSSPNESSSSTNTKEGASHRNKEMRANDLDYSDSLTHSSQATPTELQPQTSSEKKNSSETTLCDAVNEAIESLEMTLCGPPPTLLPAAPEVPAQSVSIHPGVSAQSVSIHPGVSAQSVSLSPLTVHHDPLVPVSSSSCRETQPVPVQSVPPSQHTISPLQQSAVNNWNIGPISDYAPNPTSFAPLTVSLPRTLSLPLSATGGAAQTNSVTPLNAECTTKAPSMVHSVLDPIKPSAVPTTTTTSKTTKSGLKSKLSTLAYSLQSCVAVSPTCLADLDQKGVQLEQKRSPVSLVAKSPSPQRGSGNAVPAANTFPVMSFPAAPQVPSFVNTASVSLPMQPIPPVVTSTYNSFHAPTIPSQTNSSSAPTHSKPSQDVICAPQVSSVSTSQHSTGSWSIATQSHTNTLPTAVNRNQIVAEVKKRLNIPHMSAPIQCDSGIGWDKSSVPTTQGGWHVTKALSSSLNINPGSKLAGQEGNMATQHPTRRPSGGNNSSMKKKKKGASKAKTTHSSTSTSPSLVSPSNTLKTSTKQGLSSYLERMPTGAVSSFVIPEMPLGDIQTNSLTPLPLSLQQQQPLNQEQPQQSTVGGFNPFSSFLGEPNPMAPLPSSSPLFGDSVPKQGFPPSAFYGSGIQATTTSSAYSSAPPKQTSPYTSKFQTTPLSLPITPWNKPQTPQNDISNSKPPNVMQSMWHAIKQENSVSKCSTTSPSPLGSPTYTHTPLFSSAVPPGKVFTTKSSTSNSGKQKAAGKRQKQSGTLHYTQTAAPISKVCPSSSALSSMSGPLSAKPKTAMKQSSRVFVSSHGIKVKQTSPKQVPIKAHSMLRAPMSPPVSTMQLSEQKSTTFEIAEKIRRLDILRKVQELNRGRQQLKHSKQAQSGSISEETEIINEGSLLAAMNTPLAMATLDGNKDLPSGGFNAPPQGVQNLGTNRDDIQSAAQVFPFWLPNKTTEEKQPSQHDALRRLSSEHSHSDPQSSGETVITPVLNVPTHFHLPSLSHSMSIALTSPVNIVKEELPSPQALVVRPPEPFGNLKSPITPTLTGSPHSSDKVGDTCSSDSSMVKPNVVFNPAFAGDVATMSRWELYQLYNHHKALLVKQKQIVKSLKERLVKMDKEHKSITNQNLTPSDLYKRFLGFVVEPECAVSADSTLNRLHFKVEAKDDGVNINDIIVGGTFDRPIINSKYDFYASFAK